MGWENKANESTGSRRPRYRPDQLLTAELLTAEHDHHRHRRWQLNRSLIGPGVLHGLGVIPAGPRGLRVMPGLALDAWGREIEVGPEARSIVLDEFAGFGEPFPRPGCYTLLAHHAERLTPEGGSVPCLAQDRPGDWVWSGAVFSLFCGCDATDCCACPGIEACYDPSTYLCGRQGSGASGVDPDPRLARAMGPVPPLVARPDGWHWDPRAGIPLACVEVCEEPPDEGCEGAGAGLRLADPHPCRMRPLVPRIPQLLELARECHLERPRLERLEWLPDWDGIRIGRLGWHEFLRLCKDGFRLRFTAPLRREGVHNASIVFCELRAAHWDHQDVLRVPLDFHSGDPQQGGLVREVCFTPNEGWAKGGCPQPRERSPVRIELTLRGAALRDRCGTMLDARPPGAPEGPEHARNGGDLVVAFQVEADREYAPAAEPRSGEQP